MAKRPPKTRNSSQEEDLRQPARLPGFRVVGSMQQPVRDNPPDVPWQADRFASKPHVPARGRSLLGRRVNPSPTLEDD